MPLASQQTERAATTQRAAKVHTVAGAIMNNHPPSAKEDGEEKPRAAASTTSSSSSTPREEHDDVGAQQQQRQQHRGGDDGGALLDPTISRRPAEGGGDGDDDDDDAFLLPDYKDQARLVVPPRYKDQTQTAGGSEAANEDHGGGAASYSVHLAPSVYAVAVDEEADPPPLRTAAVMPVIPAGGIDASKNTVGPVVVDDADHQRPHPSATENSSTRNNNSNSFTEETPAGGGELQQTVLRKHMIWAGACLLTMVVIAVSTTVAVVMTVDSSSTNSNTSPTKTQLANPQAAMTAVPTTQAVAEPPPVENTVEALPSLLPTVAPTNQPVGLGPSPTAAPMITEPPSTLLPTQIPAAAPTNPPTTAVVNPYSEIKLMASDGAADDLFGSSVAISGDTIVVGAREDDTENGTNSGSAYVYTRFGSGNTTVWTEQAKLVASDGAAEDWFGYSVAINGDTIVIGGWFHDTEILEDIGSVYVFTFSGSVWTEQAKLKSHDGISNDRFGTSVAIDGDTIIIGADGDDTEFGRNSGGAYLFTLLESIWTQQAKLLPSDGAADDRFGRSVAINGDTIVIGAENVDTVSGANSGSVYVYIRSGTVWTGQTKLIANDGSKGDKFGSSVAINGDTIVIGAYWYDTANSTDNGSAYVYNRFETVWTQQTKLIGSDGAANDRFGRDVAVNGDTVVVGVDYDDTKSGTDSGSAYVYTWSGTVWTEQAKLTSSDGAATDWFGSKVAIDGDSIVIGVYADNNENGENAGSIYIFD